VVEFLTDNTLGRIWYEMRQGQTGLKQRCRYLVRRPNEIWLQPGEEAPAEVVANEALSQKELLRQPVHIPYRPLKDPREIRMLDPACGSMHFGLYAFDLYLAIYEEAWEIAQGSDEQAKQGEAFAPFVTYAADFASKAALLREVPRLILLHNIHGVDIDPRATQIARLTLWLRAQRAWQEQGVEVAARPPIKRSNVVCAEPMPGEKALLRQFIEQQFPAQEQKAFGFLLETVFDHMSLAGEAGSLLRIEEEIRSTIAEAMRIWKAGPQYEQTGLFVNERPSGEQGDLAIDLSGITDKQFWEQAEHRIYSSLQTYADQKDNESGFQRRLFAEDAANGFAFIDICSRTYDVALMNPPFGMGSKFSAPYLKRCQQLSSSNLFCLFAYRVQGLARAGLVGAITDSGWLKKGDYEVFRDYMLSDRSSLRIIADLGWGVLDGANVATSLSICAPRQAALGPLICINAATPPIHAKSTEIRRYVEKISEGIHEEDCNVFVRQKSFFEAFPGKSLAFEVSNPFVMAFKNWARLQPSYALTRRGYTPGDTFRFFRCWWEIPSCTRGSEWWTLNNGGSFAPITGDGISYVAWNEVGWQSYRPLGGFRLESEEWFGRPGIGWGKRTDYMYAYPLPSGSMFSNEGHCAFPLDPTTTWPLIAYLNSSTCNELLGLYSGQHKFAGYVADLPAPDMGSAELMKAGEIAKQAWSHAANLRRRDETCEYFVATVYKGEQIPSLRQESHRVTKVIASGISEIDTLVEGVLGTLSTYGSSRDRPQYALTRLLAQEDWRKAILSYAFGVVMGRWDLRVALNAEMLAEDPDPFSAFKICSPGQLQNADSKPLADCDSLENYPCKIAQSGIIEVCRSGLASGIDLVYDMVKVLLPSGSQFWDQAASDEIEMVRILDYFCIPAEFFSDHLELYAKSRRQAPIYWQLSAGNGNYSAWLYYHRFTQDTLYRLLGDFVEIRIQEAERDQFELESQEGLSGEAAGLLHEVHALLQDLRLFKSELELVAPLWNPNLNDGVIINHAILWRITPYTPWQKKCKECWDKLVKGDYDWAHLAFHLWPERVIRKCTTDRSLAIAHGLEERLWQETSKGNGLQRQVSEAELQALLAEYSKPAVQNALERFLAAPPPVAAARTRAPRATKSSSTGSTRRPRGSAPAVDAEASRQTLLVLTAAPADGLGRNAIAELLGVEATSLTAVIKQLKEGGQIEQLGAARGAKYRLTEQGRAAVESQAGEDE
jgi:hypothetical protein